MIDYFIYTYGPTLVLAILCAIFGTLGHMAKRLYVGHINDDTKRAVAWTVVQFVEQVWQVLHGEDKLNKALETAEALLKKKGIAYDAEEMKVLIEAAVAEFNDAQVCSFHVVALQQAPHILHQRDVGQRVKAFHDLGGKG